MPNNVSEKISEVVKEASARSLRISERVDEVNKYWKSEVDHITSYAKDIWKNLGIGGKLNSSAIKAYKISTLYRY